MKKQSPIKHLPLLATLSALVITAGCTFNPPTPANTTAVETSSNDEIEEYDGEYATLTKIDGNKVYFEGNEQGKKYIAPKKSVRGLSEENNEGREFLIMYLPSKNKVLKDGTIELKDAEITASEWINN